MQCFLLYIRSHILQYPNGIFRVPLLRGWLVCCSDPQLMEEIRKASDSELSIHEWIDEVWNVLHCAAGD
jgi:hypothetical protein